MRETRSFIRIKTMAIRKSIVVDQAVDLSFSDANETFAEFVGLYPEDEVIQVQIIRERVEIQP